MKIYPCDMDALDIPNGIIWIGIGNNATLPQPLDYHPYTVLVKQCGNFVAVQNAYRKDNCWFVLNTQIRARILAYLYIPSVIAIEE